MTHDNPDFERMTGTEIMQWVKSTDDQSALLRWMKATGTGAADDEPQPPTKVIAVRMPVDIVDRLNELSVGTKDGRSGLIRRGVEELLDRIDHRDAA